MNYIERRQTSVSSRIIPVQPFDYVVFGATGDLTKRKLIPALYHRFLDGQFDEKSRIIGVSRTKLSDDDFRKAARESIAQFVEKDYQDEKVIDSFVSVFSYVPNDVSDPAKWGDLSKNLRDDPKIVRAFYLAIAPDLFGPTCDYIKKQGYYRRDARVVIEKPLGHDLQSSIEINSEVSKIFAEDQVYRIDHYLGKETVQNLLALRFANEMFEPIWNAHYVDHVQITMAEDIGLGGRAGYYDGIGAARDVIQNHLLQLLALTAMEEPVSFSPEELQAEKIKVLSATRLAEPLDQTTSRGQYTSGWQGGEKVVGLLDEEGFSKTSTTETFAAITLDVDTRRWAGVPFYLRTGKRLGRRVTEIALVFKRAPHLPFDATMTEELGKNALVIRVQPDEGITLRFGSKVPGNQMEVRDVNMDFSYGAAFAEESPEAYERLILDVLLGEPSLFPVNAEVELAWQILDPALENWASHGKPDPYESGGWGPDSAFEMLRRDGREWRRP